MLQTPILRHSNFALTAICRSRDMASNNRCTSTMGNVESNFLVSSTARESVLPSIEPYSIAAATALNTFETWLMTTGTPLNLVYRRISTAQQNPLECYKRAALLLRR
jgi:hypothetical protein